LSTIEAEDIRASRVFNIATGAVGAGDGE